MQEYVMTAADFYVSGIQKLFQSINKYLDNDGDYVDM
jgi:hypothetical protein